MTALRLALVLVVAAPGAASAQTRFDSLDEAVAAFVGARRAGDRKALAAVLGPGGHAIVSSGDDVADRRAFARFVAQFEQAHRLEGGGGRVVLYVGEDGFPLPIPLMPDGPYWRWDAAAARDEILSRRIGRNELSAIQVCLAYVDAQREYYAQDWNRDGILEYARSVASRPGRRDGLYWETRPGEAPSPLGPLVARARQGGYGPPGAGANTYHGYRYRVLLSQGPDAPGGAYDYVANEHMIGGFALIAAPSQYAVSGVMTFMVSHAGVVYEKDLGAETSRLAAAITRFNPDRTWRRVEPR